METLGKLRRRRLRDGESISGLARSLQLSRNMVRKYLKEGAESLDEKEDMRRVKGCTSRRIQQELLQHYQNRSAGTQSSLNQTENCPESVE
jgi:hypothetical protein